MAYQWNDAVAPPVSNCERVPAERHPGLFAPYGYEGDIVVGGMVLCERPKAEVDAFHAETARKAEKNVTDWIQRQSDNGIAGHVSVVSDGEIATTEIGPTPITRRTKIPPDLLPYIVEIFNERDRLMEFTVGSEIGTPGWYSDRAKFTELAIEKVRARLQKDPVT